MKSVRFILALGLVLVAGQVMAFGPSSVLDKNISGTSTEANVKKVTKEVAKAGIEAGLNDKLKKEGCAFKNDTTKDETTCDLNKVIGYLSNWRKGLTNTVANDVNVYIEASAKKSGLASDRASHVEGVMRKKLSYWDWYTQTTTKNGNGLKIWVTVK